MLRMRLLLSSATKSAPTPSMVIPLGALNFAARPMPSVLPNAVPPTLPPPARVVTVPGAQTASEGEGVGQALPEPEGEGDALAVGEPPHPGATARMTLGVKPVATITPPAPFAFTPWQGVAAIVETAPVAATMTRMRSLTLSAT